ncbi:MAG TPA: cytochrome c oxidase accessory protein CcoG, partial [Algoriphagus sp.]|nr:cytochrome c oxidase accessory protein CcoG [Algoriphagus sp.]
SNLVLQPQSKVEGRFFLVKNQTKVSVPQEKVNLSLIHEGEEIDQINTSFMAPVAKKQ